MTPTLSQHHAPDDEDDVFGHTTPPTHCNTQRNLTHALGLMKTGETWPPPADIYAISTCSRTFHHLPLRMQERAECGFLCRFDAVPLLHLPRMQERAKGRYLLCFDAVLASSTSLSCKGKQEVDLYSVSTPFPLPFNTVSTTPPT